MKITKISTHVINMPLKLGGDVPHVGGQAKNVAHAFDFQRLFAQGALSVAQPSVTKVGRIPVPQGPGLGLDPDPDVLKRLAIG